MLGLDATYLQSLFLHVNVTDQQDVAKLAQAAQLVLSCHDSAGKHVLQLPQHPSCFLEQTLSRLVHSIIVATACRQPGLCNAGCKRRF